MKQKRYIIILKCDVRETAVCGEMVNEMFTCECYCLQTYQAGPREQWVKEWPGQVILCTSQIFWTAEVHDAIREGPGGLKKYHESLNNQLLNIVELVRGKLTMQQRITLGALVVIDVHARDVVSDMNSNGVENENDFNWLAQLRYYWEDNNCWVKITNARVKYAYEYLGNSGRSVWRIWHVQLLTSKKQASFI